MTKTPEEKIKLLFQTLADLNPENFTKSEFIAAFENVVNLVKRIESQNIKDFEDLRRSMAALSEKVANDAMDNVDNLRKVITDFVSSSMDQMMKEHHDKMMAMDEKMDSIQDGKDADEELIVERVKNDLKIPTIEELKNDLPKMGMQIRDALELLQGPERLNVSAIDGLTELLDEIKKYKGKQTGGINYGAMMMHEVDGETPVDSGDHLTFTISKIPSPASSLKVFRNGYRQKIGVDYTFSGRNITLLTAFDPDNENILVDYKI